MKSLRLPLRSLLRKPGRTAVLLALVALLAFAVFGGGIVVMSLQNGLKSLEGRIGADVIAIPTTAKSKIDIDDVLLTGTSGYYYTSRDYIDEIAEIEGVEKVSGQLYLASLRADCCSIPVQVIGFDPETDFSVQPWIRRSYGKALEDYDVVVGSSVNADVGEDIIIYKQKCHVVARLETTGTDMDTAIYATTETTALLLQAAKDLGHDLKISGDPADVVSAIYIKVKDGVDPDTVTDYINVHLRKLKAGTAKSMLTGISDSLAALQKTVKAVIAAVWVLVLLVLFAAFILMIRSRRREFAVLRVAGASRGMLSGMVIREALLVSLAGWLLGVGLAAAASFPFSKMIETALDLPFLTPDVGTSLALAGGTLLAVCLTGSAAAAWTAGRLSRVDAGTALREEN